MQGNIVSAARWVFGGMVVSTAIFVAGVFFTVHSEKLCPWLFETRAQCPSCVPETPVPPVAPSF
jgi:hypothetical protein